MAINFPDNRDQLVPPQPSGPIQTGDVYVYNGTTYVATVLSDSSVRWDAAVSAGSDAYVLKVGDTMTGQLTLPGGGTGNEAATVSQIPVVPAALWQRDGGTSTLSPATADDNLNQGSGNITTTGNLGAAAGTFSGDVSAANFTTTGDVQATSLNSGPLAGFRNQIINGNLEINQRNSTDITSSQGFMADRWFKGSQVGFRCQHSNIAPTGFTKSFAISGSTDSPMYQSIELPAAGVAGIFSVGSQWTLSLWARCASGGDVRLSKRFINDMTANSTDESAQTFTLDTNWQRISWTFTVGSAPNAANTSFQILVVGLTVNEIFFTGVQLEPGPVSTPFEVRPIQTELALCQRYFQVLGPMGRVPGAASSPTSLVFPLALATPLRSTPSFVSNSVAQIKRYDSVNVSTGSASFSVGTFSKYKATIDYSVTGVSVSDNHSYWLTFTSLNLDAEL